MNYREIDEFAPSLPTGAAVISVRLGTLDWCRLAKFFKGEEGSNVYENFRRSADENYSSVVVSAMINAQLNNSPFSYEELDRLQSYYLDAYLQSCRFLKDHSSSPKYLLKSQMLEQFTQLPWTTKLPNSLMLERLTQLKDRVRPASMTWVLEKIPGLKNLGGVKPGGRLTLYGFIFGAGTLAGLATAKAKA